MMLSVKVLPAIFFRVFLFRLTRIYLTPLVHAQLAQAGLGAGVWVHALGVTDRTKAPEHATQRLLTVQA